jgi:hypothetical protein
MYRKNRHSFFFILRYPPEESIGPVPGRNLGTKKGEMDESSCYGQQVDNGLENRDDDVKEQGPVKHFHAHLLFGV